MSECFLRKCVSCKEEKPATNEFFYKDKNRSLGLMYRCKTCDSARKDNRTWKQRVSVMSPESKDKMKNRMSKYNTSSKGRAMHLAVQYRNFDKDKKLENNITKEDILEVRTKECIYCGFPATGFDRVDNKLGHIKDNCVPCCKECNVARMDNFTQEEMFILGKTIREIKQKRIIKN